MKSKQKSDKEKYDNIVKVTVELFRIQRDAGPVVFKYTEESFALTGAIVVLSNLVDEITDKDIKNKLKIFRTKKFRALKDSLLFDYQKVDHFDLLAYVKDIFWYLDEEIISDANKLFFTIC